MMRCADDAKNVAADAETPGTEAQTNVRWQGSAPVRTALPSGLEDPDLSEFLGLVGAEPEGV